MTEWNCNTETQMVSLWNPNKLSDIYVLHSMGKDLGRIKLRSVRKNNCWNCRWRRSKIQMDSWWVCWMNIKESRMKLTWWLILVRNQLQINESVCLHYFFYISHDNFIFFTVTLNFSWYFIKFSWLWMITLRYF